MKKRLLIIMILSILFSCQVENKTVFIGNWSSTSDTNFNIDISFRNDLLLIEDPVTLYDTIYSSKWKVIGKKIKYDDSTWDYILNVSQDTLWIKHETDSTFDVSFRRIRNNIEYFENSIGLNLKLPKTSEKLTSIGNKEFVFPIYLAKKNDSIIIKTDGYFQRFDKLEYQVISYYYSKKKEEKDSLKFSLFTDNSIKTKELDSIKRILKKLPIKKFFRVYDNEKYINGYWKAEIKWVGKYEN